MRILVLGWKAEAKYSGVFLKNFLKALSLANIDFDFASLSEDIRDYSGYDLYIGAGDQVLSRRPKTVSHIKEFGGTVIDTRAKAPSLKLKTVITNLTSTRSEIVDYHLTHMLSSRPNCFYIGQGIDETQLYPEQDGMFTVFVDHWMGPRNKKLLNPRRPKVQEILDQCKTLFNTRDNVRIWYQSSQGIVENSFVEDREAYKLVPFEELAAYYRKTHVFLPTHRETLGIVAAEIGLCGGVTLLQNYMYPKQTRVKVPHQLYFSKIPWPDKVDFEDNRQFTREHYGMETYAERIKTALQKIYEARQLNIKSNA